MVVMGDDATARVFEALGNAVRRDIVEALSEAPQSVGALALRLPVSRPAVSRHLRVLQEAGLVVHEGDGSRNVYRLRDAGFALARGWLMSFWDAALPRFAMLANNLVEDDDE